MHTCRILRRVLVGLLTLAVLPSESATVKVKRHDATLPCKEPDCALVSWTLFDKPHDILAQCDQTSCQSEHGFHMSHEQYLKGDLSLTITDADFTKGDFYTCNCDGLEICNLQLQVEGNNTNTTTTLPPVNGVNESWVYRDYIWLMGMFVIVVVVVVLLCCLIKHCLKKVRRGAQCFSRSCCTVAGTCDPSAQEHTFQCAAADSEDAALTTAL
ncbi:uncharacterized protein LOC118243045 isoform X1 [Electrophorus electricus]|uniref:uncharacterized protein LOC118243045 isoform X1 n=1 Tax=Electrophorus electricus TaxID=8005 RepID=UPI0015CF8A17|nr:uncharacterized protein LOC118243045 isoform X1 [Electrophorus electricus]XP_035392520.1 uncharacterized protein LOC118243045 isoform X1 [Electrophorus electricus]